MTIALGLAASFGLTACGGAKAAKDCKDKACCDTAKGTWADGKDGKAGTCTAKKEDANKDDTKKDDKKGKYAQYRFFAYVSSMYHKCEILVNEVIPGKSGKDHKIPVAVKVMACILQLHLTKPLEIQLTKNI